MGEVFADFGLDDLKIYLAKNREIMETDQQKGMKKTLYVVSLYLKNQGVDPDLLRPLDDLAIGMLDLQNGNIPDFFRPNRDVPNTLAIPKAAQMAIASAAVTLAPKGQRRVDITAKAAGRLGISRTKLMNFRKSLSAGRIKSFMAIEIYGSLCTLHSKGGDDERYDVSNTLLTSLDQQ